MYKTYEEAKTSAQKSADELGLLYRIVHNSLFKEWSVRMVPQLRYQFGSDRVGELVEPQNWEACLKARGPGGELTSDPETAFSNCIFRRLEGKV